MKDQSIQKIGILCGQGDLPLRIMAACATQGIPCFAVAFLGQTPKASVDHIDHGWFHLGDVGSILSALSDQGVSHVVLAGRLRRPSWSELSLDWKGAQWLSRIGLKAVAGDDGLLSAVTGLLDAEGFKVLPPSVFLTNLLCPAKCLTIKQPTDLDSQDAQRGFLVLSLLDGADVGQAVVVQQGLVLAIEAIEGTAQMIQRAGSLKRPGPGGTLVKAMKHNQNKTVDLPTIGPSTMGELSQAGLNGVVVRAHTTQIIDFDETVEIANQLGLFVMGVD